MKCAMVVSAACLLLSGSSAFAQDPPRDAPPPHVAAARQEAALKAEIAAEGLTSARAVALARYQVTRGGLDDAEKTLLEARKLFPADMNVTRSLLDVYERQIAAERDPERKLTLVGRAAHLRGEIGGGQGSPCRPATELVDGMRPIRVGGSIKAPTKTKDARPIYPPDAQKARVSGTVILEITLDSSGRVAYACVLRSVPELEAAAVDAVKQWEFAPTLLNGAPAPVIMTVTVNFTLQ